MNKLKKIFHIKSEIESLEYKIATFSTKEKEHYLLVYSDEEISTKPPFKIILETINGKDDDIVYLDNVSKIEFCKKNSYIILLKERIRHSEIKKLERNLIENHYDVISEFSFVQKIKESLNFLYDFNF